MRTIVTKSGLENMRIKLSKKIVELKLLREEKAHAYSASGDGWHDNPGWIQLGQQEEIVAAEVSVLQQKIASAIIIDPELIDRNRVNIGCNVEYYINRNNIESIQSMSIVGSGESDIKNNKISLDSPIGKALFQLTVGEDKKVILPTGCCIIKIKSILYE